jgi:hypothetical protein
MNKLLELNTQICLGSGAVLLLAGGPEAPDTAAAVAAFLAQPNAP